MGMGRTPDFLFLSKKSQKRPWWFPEKAPCPVWGGPRWAGKGAAASTGPGRGGLQWVWPAGVTGPSLVWPAASQAGRQRLTGTGLRVGHPRPQPIGAPLLHRATLDLVSPRPLGALPDSDSSGWNLSPPHPAPPCLGLAVGRGAQSRRLRDGPACPLPWSKSPCPQSLGEVWGQRTSRESQCWFKNFPNSCSLQPGPKPDWGGRVPLAPCGPSRTKGPPSGTSWGTLSSFAIQDSGTHTRARGRGAGT